MGGRRSTRTSGVPVIQTDPEPVKITRSLNSVDSLHLADVRVCVCVQRAHACTCLHLQH